MTEMPVVVADPVCGMVVPAGQHEAVHLEMAYAFCSEQCRGRFLAHPHLYVGRPGQKAPKQEGRAVIEHRRLHLSVRLPAKRRGALDRMLRRMMGVEAVRVEADRIEVAYDLLQVTAEQIEEKISQAGARLGAGWPGALHLAFIHYVEDCTIGNLEVTEPHLNGRMKRPLPPAEPFIP